MAEYTVESIQDANTIINYNIKQLKQQIITEFRELLNAKHLEIEFKPLNEIAILLTGDEAKKQVNSKYMYRKEYSIKLKDANDCEAFTSMHLTNCFIIFSNGASLEERFNTCKVPIAVNIDGAENLESCVENICATSDYLDKCIDATDDSFSCLAGLVHRA